MFPRNISSYRSEYFINKSTMFLLLQDLQSEIETHRDVYTSLNGTGRKLLSSLASQDDAVMLQRRLDEMNQRWHHLKAKSMAIRWVASSSSFSSTILSLSHFPIQLAFATRDVSGWNSQVFGNQVFFFSRQTFHFGCDIAKEKWL